MQYNIIDNYNITFKFKFRYCVSDQEFIFINKHIRTINLTVILLMMY